MRALHSHHNTTPTISLLLHLHSLPPHLLIKVPSPLHLLITLHSHLPLGLIHLNKTHTSFTQRLISFFFCLGLFTLSFYYIVKDQVQREKGIKEIRHSSFLFTGGSFHYSHSERYLQVIKVVPCASLPFSLPLFFHAVIMERSGSMNRMN